MKIFHAQKYMNAETIQTWYEMAVSVDYWNVLKIYHQMSNEYMKSWAIRIKWVDIFKYFWIWHISMFEIVYQKATDAQTYTCTSHFDRYMKGKSKKKKKILNTKLFIFFNFYFINYYVK